MPPIHISIVYCNKYFFNLTILQTFTAFIFIYWLSYRNRFEPISSQAQLRKCVGNLNHLLYMKCPSQPLYSYRIAYSYTVQLEVSYNVLSMRNLIYIYLYYRKK